MAAPPALAHRCQAAVRLTVLPTRSDSRTRLALATASASSRAPPSPRRTSPTKAVDVIHQEATTYPQLQQIRDLIQKQPNAIIFNPNSPDGYQDALDEAQTAGITTVARSTAT